MLDESEIAWSIRNFLCALRHQWITPNTKLYPWESDILSVDFDGFACEFEIKCSRSDLKNDLRKAKHKDGLLLNGHFPRPDHVKNDGEVLLCSRPNYFSFVMPCELYRKQPQPALPDYAGAYTVDHHGRIREERPPRRLHGKRMPSKERLLLARRIHHRYWNELRRARHDPEHGARQQAGMFHSRDQFD